MFSSHEALAHSLRRFVFEYQSDVSLFILAAVDLDARSSELAAETVVDRVAHLRRRDIERLFRLLADTPNQFFGTMTAGEIRCALREFVDADWGRDGRLSRVGSPATKAHIRPVPVHSLS